MKRRKENLEANLGTFLSNIHYRICDNLMRNIWTFHELGYLYADLTNKITHTGSNLALIGNKLVDLVDLLHLKIHWWYKTRTDVFFWVLGALGIVIYV